MVPRRSHSRPFLLLVVSIGVTFGVILSKITATAAAAAARTEPGTGSRTQSQAPRAAAAAAAANANAGSHAAFFFSKATRQCHTRLVRQSSRSLSMSRPSPSSPSPSSTPLSKLPRGISPFEKSLSKSLDVQSGFRSLAKIGIDAAMSDSVPLLEVEFPPLIGGTRSKSQFDDFDNVQELDANKDWTVNFAPMFIEQKPQQKRQQQQQRQQLDFGNGKTWLVFPDLKECELARAEWAGKRYRSSTFTTIEEATAHFCGRARYVSPWGASLVSGLSKMMGGSGSGSESEKGGETNGGRRRGSSTNEGRDGGLMGDRSSLDDLIEGRNSPPTLVLAIQPGNGGPVEDWINCEQLYLGAVSASATGIGTGTGIGTTMVIVNGALDKVRGGYYPGVFFPKLAETVDRFYRKFDSAFYLKPLSDKGCYGWLYRVYPEPWQVVLQTVKEDKRGQMYVQDTVVYTSYDRPSYNDAVAMLVAASKVDQ